MTHPPDRALLVFDGHCGLCRRWVARWQRVVGESADAVASQDDEIAARFPELQSEALARAVHLIEPDGRVTRGAEAVVRSLAPVWSWPRWLYAHFPGGAALSEALYRIIARHRACRVVCPRAAADASSPPDPRASARP